MPDPVGDVRRRLRLTLSLQADDLDEMRRALEQIALDFLVRPREDAQVTSGGWASGYSLRLDCDPEMDGDTYRALLEKWRTERVEASRAQSCG